jgi:hypothetical protein
MRLYAVDFQALVRASGDVAVTAGFGAGADGGAQLGDEGVVVADQSGDALCFRAHDKERLLEVEIERDACGEFESELWVVDVRPLWLV